MPRKDKLNVVLVTETADSAVLRILRRQRFHLQVTYTADRAVALCASQAVAAVVIEQSVFVEVESWSLAMSLKLVCPGVCNVLITQHALAGQPLPRGIDVAVPVRSLRTLPRILRQLKGTEAA